VKLLFDQNLSHRLVPAIADVFPDSAHVRQFNLSQESDETVWNFARERDYTIISKDSDFHQRSFLYGSPPRVIWLQAGNCSTHQIEMMIRTNVIRIIAFDRDLNAGFLVLK
jgi:predicted nuclease of predicted toxin-antitoxin system